MTFSKRLSLLLSLSVLSVSACASSTDAQGEGAASLETAPAIELTALAPRGCPGCHDGARGRLSGSDTPVPGTHAYAPNLTPDVDTGVGGWTDEQLARAIRTGEDDQGDMLCATMPRFGDIGDAEMKRILAELRALPSVRHQTADSECGAPGSGSAAPPERTSPVR